MSVNLASEANAAKINQRFKELETEILELKKANLTNQNTIGNLQNLINKQTEMIQNVWVGQYGTGPTEKDNG